MLRFFKSILGPIVQNHFDSAILVGINSWGTGCETEDPDVYTNVAKYSQWIIKNTNCKKFNGFIVCPNYKGEFQNIQDILKSWDP